MAFIQLTRGFITKVDDDLLDELNSYLWYASGLEGRPARRLKAGPRKIIFIYHQILHVLPWVMSMQNMVVDHIDGDPLNNTRENLRLVSRTTNMQNSDRHKFREGIGYDSTHDRYKVYIDRPNLPRINIGTYKTREEADAALISARTKFATCE